MSLRRTGFARKEWKPGDPTSSLTRKGDLDRGKPLAHRSKKKRRGPLRDPRFLRFVRSLRCCVCGTDVNVIAHHMVEGDGDDRRGMSQKVSDHKTMPFCDGRALALSHHKQFHRRLGVFKGWENERRRVFQEEEIARVRKMYETLCELGTLEEPEPVRI